LLLHRDKFYSDDNHPIQKYVAFSSAHCNTFALLEREGVLTSVSEIVVKQLATDASHLIAEFESLGTAIPQLRERIAKESFEKSFLSSREASLPSIDSILELLLEIVIVFAAMQRKEWEEKYNNVRDEPQSIAKLAHSVYCLFLTYSALKNGWAPTTWRPESQNVFNACARLLGTATIEEEVEVARSGIANKLGGLVIRELVPDVCEMPFESILDIRRRRQSELQRFRDGLRQLSSQIDPTQDERATALQLEALVQSVVKPALAELTTAIGEIQSKAYMKMLSPPKNISDFGAVLIPVAISHASAAPTHITAAVGVIGGMLSRLYEFFVGAAIEKRSKLSGDPWSILFHLRK